MVINTNFPIKYTIKEILYQSGWDEIYPEFFVGGYVLLKVYYLGTKID